LTPSAAFGNVIGPPPRVGGLRFPVAGILERAQEGVRRGVGALEGRVVIITGAGGGLGRQHALLFAQEGACVVVNDRGSALDGSDGDTSAAGAVVAEIEDAGGRAVANTDDVSDWEGARALVQTALESFGSLDVLVNNAGILRDRSIVNMTEAEWDDVVRVHLKGHFAPTHFAAVHWREQARAGSAVRASVINTSSTSGLIGNIGQSNYGAAKAGIAAFTVIAAQELSRYGVRVNAIAPGARTRMTEQAPGLGDIVAAPSSATAFDLWDPANVSPLVAYLATSDCPANGRVFFVTGGRVSLFSPWDFAASVERSRRWTVDELARAMVEELRVDEPVDARPFL
jgi:NAD(P)-dependent dehydrogenase (short-subunit alcohol dehydrogenase family)